MVAVALWDAAFSSILFLIAIPLLSIFVSPLFLLAYVFDLGVGAADLLVGFSRWPWLLRALERSSWRRFERHHLPKLRALRAEERR